MHSELESFVIFRYSSIQWSTGQVSGDREALSGINVGDGVNSITIPGSLTAHIINITQTSNVGFAGTWIFKTSEGTNYFLTNWL